MTRELKAIEIDDAPDLLRIAEEVKAADEPRLLRRGGEDIAIMMPIKPAVRRRPKKTRAGYDGFRAAAGGWSDVDTDRLIADIYADRESGDRPPVDL